MWFWRVWRFWRAAAASYLACGVAGRSCCFGGCLMRSSAGSRGRALSRLGDTATLDSDSKGRCCPATAPRERSFPRWPELEPAVEQVHRAFPLDTELAPLAPARSFFDFFFFIFFLPKPRKRPLLPKPAEANSQKETKTDNIRTLSSSPFTTDTASHRHDVRPTPPTRNAACDLVHGLSPRRPPPTPVLVLPRRRRRRRHGRDAEMVGPQGPADISRVF